MRIVSLIILSVYLALPSSAFALTIDAPHGANGNANREAARSKDTVAMAVDVQGNNVEVPSNVFNALFPVSSSLSPGRVKSKKIAKSTFPSDTPLFIVSDDDMSIKWLKRNHDYLVSIGAIGLVTNLQSPDDYKRVQVVTTDLSIMPMNPDALIAGIGIQHYPVLISDGEVTQ